MKNGSVKIAKRKFSQFDTSQTLETAFGNIGRADLRVESESNHATNNIIVEVQRRTAHSASVASAFAPVGECAARTLSQMFSR